MGSSRRDGARIRPEEHAKIKGEDEEWSGLGERDHDSGLSASVPRLLPLLTAC